ncbi:MAG: TSUP family transporter [Pseudomonadales bacterium]
MPDLDIHAIYFLLLVGVGAMVQTATGFAMGLIIMGGVTALGLADIGKTAAVVGYISLVNALVALRTTHRFMDKKVIIDIALGMVPMIIVGIVLLNLLSVSAAGLLRLMLGLVIVSAGFFLMLKPTPYEFQSSRLMTILTGGAGGLIGGMYGAGGAPMAYFMYRQPIELNVIRASLLAIFAISTSFRTVSITVAGQVDQEILVLAALSVPIVVFVTLLTTKFSQVIPDIFLRRLVFVILISLGLFLIFS